jgi:hypothetical protein
MLLCYSLKRFLFYNYQFCKGGIMAKKAKCASKTKEGKKCKNFASGKSKFCSSHKKR